jgi:hypothetical protein
MQRLGVAVFLLSASVAQARPGFYVGLGGGGTGVSGKSGIGEGELGRDDQGIPYIPSVPGYTFDTKNAGGPTALFRLGFNILGYVAIEAVTSGHGKDLTDEDVREWAAHAQLGARVYPLWHWQHRLPAYLQPMEPSIFLGWGASYQVYTPEAGGDPVGWEDWGSMRLGLAVEYFVIEYFKVGLDWNYIRANYDNFIYNAEEGIDFPVHPAATTTYQQLYFTIAFQFGSEQRTVRYTEPPIEIVPDAPAPAPSPEPAPAIIDG